MTSNHEVSIWGIVRADQKALLEIAHKFHKRHVRANLGCVLKKEQVLHACL